MKTLTCHGAIILSLMYLTFFIVDRFNSAMSFINNDITKTLILLLSAISFYHACAIQKSERAKIRRREEKRRQALQAQKAARKAQAAAPQKKVAAR